MSVINQMLRDLDARQASEQERAGLPPRLRPLPPATLARAQSWRMLLAGMGIGGLAAGLVVALMMSPSPAPNAVPPAPQVTTAVPPAPTSAGSSAPTSGVQAVDVGEMKLSTLLALAQSQTQAENRATPQKPSADVKKPERETAVAKPPVPTSKPATPATREARSSAPAPAVEVETAGGDTQIDKRNKGGPGREMAETEYRKGMQAVKRGEQAAGLPLFRHALELDPRHARARQALLSVLVGGKQWDEARKVAEAGLALEPAQSGWAVILARLQFEQGDAAAAVATLERHAAHATADADYQSLFAYLLQKEQRPAEAAEHFRVALALRPGEGRWWFGLGVALENDGRSEEARQAYVRAGESGNLPADMRAAVEQKLRSAHP